MTARFATLALALFGAVTVTTSSPAGEVYRVTATRGGKPLTYEVKFGGGKLFEQWTAFDPVSKKFVYLTWPRRQDRPKPTGSIWDHRTGQTINLYKFPGVEQPLPVIPSIDDLKFDPLTGDTGFTATAVVTYD
jgi:hypothetical protein